MQNKNGFSLIEALVSLALLMISIQLGVEVFHHIHQQDQKTLETLKTLEEQRATWELVQSASKGTIQSKVHP
jgi:type II secretory pathway component PulJ